MPSAACALSQLSARLRCALPGWGSGSGSGSGWGLALRVAFVAGRTYGQVLRRHAACARREA
eukprot:scaffold70230_cov45-Phaeocystis_antarctica.AAC.1